MNQGRSVIRTKYASFDAQKVRKHKRLSLYFDRRHISQVNQLLDKQEAWQLYETLDKTKNIDRQSFLQCMVANYCYSIDFKYLWGAQINLLLHIQFRSLRILSFSVDYDNGYLKSIDFLPNLDAPNLEILDCSRMEDGGYSLRPLRRCNFPKLKTVDLSSHANFYRDLQRLPQAYFPALSQFVLYTQDYEERVWNGWKAKMQSPSIREELKEQMEHMSQR